MKRIVSITLVLVILISVFNLPVYAQSGTDYSESTLAQPRFTYIQSTETNVGIADGKVTVIGSLKCHSGVTDCEVIVFLQRRAIGTSTWYNYTFDTASGTMQCTASVTIAATSGYEYRAKAEYSANDGAETTTAYSVIAQYNPSN